MSKMSKEEKWRLIKTPTKELLESGEWVKLYDAINPSLKLYDYTEEVPSSNKSEDPNSLLKET